jgi:hypothetical protein
MDRKRKMTTSRRSSTKDAPMTSGTYAVITGPISGPVTLPDGREFDVTPGFIMVDDQATADAVAAAIGEAHAENGHPTDPNFVYVPKED